MEAAVRCGHRCSRWSAPSGAAAGVTPYQHSRPSKHRNSSPAVVRIAQAPIVPADSSVARRNDGHHASPRGARAEESFIRRVRRRCGYRPSPPDVSPKNAPWPRRSSGTEGIARSPGSRLTLRGTPPSARTPARRCRVELRPVTLREPVLGARIAVRGIRRAPLRRAPRPAPPCPRRSPSDRPPPDAPSPARAWPAADSVA